MGNIQLPAEPDVHKYPPMLSSEIVIDEFRDHHKDVGIDFELKASERVIAQLSRYARKEGYFSLIIGKVSKLCFSWLEPGYEEIVECNGTSSYQTQIEVTKTRTNFCVRLRFSDGEVKMCLWFDSIWHNLEGFHKLTWNDTSILLTKAI